jgi:hypothetical protein
MCSILSDKSTLRICAPFCLINQMEHLFWVCSCQTKLEHIFLEPFWFQRNEIWITLASLCQQLEIKLFIYFDFNMSFTPRNTDKTYSIISTNQHQVSLRRFLIRLTSQTQILLNPGHFRANFPCNLVKYKSKQYCSHNSLRCQHQLMTNKYNIDEDDLCFVSFRSR